MRLLGLVLLALLTAGCAWRFPGIDTSLRAPPTELSRLAWAARSGDKAAQLALGVRYETGDGVPRNLHLAERLYFAAASQSGGLTLIHSPAIGSASADVHMFNDGQIRPGLPEARERLERLRARR